MNKWIILHDNQYVDGLTVHEVKCPMCGHRETFHAVPPKSCYLCELPLEYDDGCKCDQCKWFGIPATCEPCHSCGYHSGWCKFESKFESYLKRKENNNI